MNTSHFGKKKNDDFKFFFCLRVNVNARKRAPMLNIKKVTNSLFWLRIQINARNVDRTAIL